LGAVIMIGTLSGLIILIFAIVLRFDPEARGETGENANPSKRQGNDHD